MRNKLRKLCIISGLALIFAACILCVFNITESNIAARRSQASLSKLKNTIELASEATVSGNTGNDALIEYDHVSQGIPVVTLDDINFCGYLTIEELDMELPVIDDFSYESLKYAPCRYSGSANGNDLIIAAHNFSSHFGKLNRLSDGTEIVYTDCSGKEYHYSLISIEEISGSNVEEMLSQDSSPWDLTLFTCTLNGKSRVTVRAKRTN